MLFTHNVDFAKQVLITPALISIIGKCTHLVQPIKDHVNVHARLGMYYYIDVHYGRVNYSFLFPEFAVLLKYLLLG